MRIVSDAFRNAVTAYGRQLKVSVVIGGNELSDSSIVSVRHAFEGGLLRSVMREFDIELEGIGESIEGVDITVTDDGEGNISVVSPVFTVTTNEKGNVVLLISGASVASDNDGNVEITTADSFPVASGTEIDRVSVGVKELGDTEYSMIDLGGCVINEVEWDKANNSVVLKCYDKMLYSMVPYDLDLTYPLTLGAYLGKICERFDWVLGTEEFTNSGVEIEEEKYTSEYTFRDVLDQIAQAAGGTIAFRDGALCVLYPSESGEVYTADNMVASDGITVGEVYGPVNALVLARTPQEDNIYRLADGAAIEDAVEIKIENNQLMDSHREDFMDGIFERVNGLSYNLYSFHSFGYLIVDLLDFFTLEDQNGSEYKCLMLSDEFTVGQGLDETSSCEAPEETETDYAAASESDRVINQTILRVDKQEQEISSLVSTTTQIEGSLENTRQELTEVKQTAESVKISVTKIEQNGAEKVQTGMGYTFDDEGLKIAKDGESIENRIDNTGMYVENAGETVLSANNTGVDAINVKVNQYLVVGERTRFEDFDDNGKERTGCFWL